MTLVYRNAYEITEDILDTMIASGQQGTQITYLLRQSNLPYKRLQSFISKLTQSNMITKVEMKGKKIFIITDKGKVYLEEYKKFSKIAETFGLEL
jgi:predicted transcriptional regulator|tara:strand:- start:75 stop:359 length:285 start_codon:yes stop_codon:yes gene_type:complete